MEKPPTDDTPALFFFYLFIRGVGCDTISSLVFLEGFQALGWKDFLQEYSDEREVICGSVCRI